MFGARMAVAVLMALPAAAAAQSGAPLETAGRGPDQPAAAVAKKYTLFNRTPWSAARELSTDRPDMTESPYTVPAGRMQFEFDLVNYTRDVSGTGADRTRFESLAIAPVNLKVGVLHNVDLQLVLATFVRDRQQLIASGVTTTSSGLGEITGRLKINLWGNDGGKTAAGIMPFISFVPNDDGGRYTNGGVILPLAINAGGGFEVGTMAEFDFERSDLTGKHHTIFVNSVTVGHELGGQFGGYAELFSAVSTEPGARWIGTFDLGLTRGLGPNVQLDAGANIGLSRAADGFNPFLGLSFRF